MLELMPWFFKGMAFGIAFGFTWNVHKYGKIIMVALVFVSVGVISFYPGEFVASFDPWPYELANFIGLIFGNIIGRWIVDDIKKS